MQFDPAKYLGSWVELNAGLLTMNEWECDLVLRAEMEGRNRKSFLKRIHSRINYLRAHRERAELAG